jgi:hypothetical protein
MRFIDTKANYKIGYDEDGHKSYYRESYKGHKAAPLMKDKYTYGDNRFRRNIFKTSDNWLIGD